MYKQKQNSNDRLDSSLEFEEERNIRSNYNILSPENQDRIKVAEAEYEAVLANGKLKEIGHCKKKLEYVRSTISQPEPPTATIPAQDTCDDADLEITPADSITTPTIEQASQIVTEAPSTVNQNDNGTIPEITQENSIRNNPDEDNEPEPEDVEAEPEKKKKSQKYIEALANLGYSFRLNECNDNIEVNGEPITDPLRAKIRTQLRDTGYGKKGRSLLAVEEAYIAHAYDNSYHPVRDYITSLQWNGESQIEQLAGYFQDNDGIFQVWLKLWLIGAIAKVMERGQNKMLVLDGPQGCGKSFFASWLGSVLPEYHIESAINPDDKDSWIRLMSKWIWEVAELGATTRRADREGLKNFITAQWITTRKPYGRFDTNKPAMASLIGTINNEAGFLSDPTGNRRFLVCGLKSIDWNYASNIDPNQLWAEAYHLYLDGHRWELTPEEQVIQRAINSRYRVESVVVDLFLEYYKINPEATEVIRSSDIIRHLEENGLRGSQRANQMELAGFLKGLGVQKVNKPRGYRGISLRDEGDDVALETVEQIPF